MNVHLVREICFVQAQIAFIQKSRPAICGILLTVNWWMVTSDTELICSKVNVQTRLCWGCTYHYKYRMTSKVKVTVVHTG